MNHPAPHRPDTSASSTSQLPAAQCSKPAKTESFCTAESVTGKTPPTGSFTASEVSMKAELRQKPLCQSYRKAVHKLP